MFKKIVIALVAVVVFVVPALAEFEVMHNEYGNMSLFGLIQARHAYVFTADGVMPTSTFTVPHARIGVKGKVYDFGSYVVLYDAINPNGLFVGYGRLDFAPVGITLGLYKTPYGIEFLQAPMKNLTINTAGITGTLPGVQAGLILDAKLNFGEYGWVKPVLSVYNGTVRAADNNSCKDMAFGLYANPINMEFFKDFQVFGGYVMENPNFDISDSALKGSNFVLTENTQYGGGASLESPMFTFQGEYYSTTYGNNNVTDADDVTDVGYYAQGSYRWYTGLDWLHAVEPLVKYEGYDPNDNVNDDTTTIITPGVNLHFADLHRFKLQFNYRLVQEEGAEVDNDEVLTQLSVLF